MNERNGLMERVFSHDKSSSAIENTFVCRSSYPEASMKQEMWKKAMDPKSDLSDNMKEAIFRGFQQWDQDEVRKPYIQEFLTTVFDVYKNSSFKFFKKFFFNNLPRHNEIDMTFIEKLKDLKKNATASSQKPGAKNTQSFENLLQEGIEIMSR